MNDKILVIGCSNLEILTAVELICNDKIDNPTNYSFKGEGVIEGDSEEIFKELSKIGKVVKGSIEDLGSPIPFNTLKKSMAEIRQVINFKEKPVKKNFVNKFNKNQHRK